MQKVVLRLDLQDEKAKLKVMKTVSVLSGVESISMHMKEKKLTVVGDNDPVRLVSKLRKLCHTEIVSAGPAKEEKKKEEPKKEEAKKDDNMDKKKDNKDDNKDKEKENKDDNKDSNSKDDASELVKPPNSDPAVNPIFITNESLHSIISHQSLIQHLETCLPTASSTLETPTRQSYSISASSSLLVMPSWSSSPTFLPYIGVKLVTHFPHNSSTLHLPGIHASYVLFSSTNGRTLASMDGTLLTLYRTACVSGLASKLLARDDPKVLVMIGAGALAPHLIRSHLAARPTLEKVIVWNRTMKKADDLVEALVQEWAGSGSGSGSVCFQSIEDLDYIVQLGDIVSCATNAEVPLVKGEKLKAGAHLDLVGSFKETMRECDDEAIRRGTVFVDNEAALAEAGELVGALQRGVVERQDVGYLVDLITGDTVGRANSEQITVFKSVGSALVDVLAAQLVYESYTIRNQ